MPGLHRRDSTETLVEIHPRSFGVKNDDATCKVLPAAMKRYRLDCRDWRRHVLFICYDPDANVQSDEPVQHCFSYDEKPLQAWAWLSAKGKHPAFMIKHVDEVKSPIAIIRERHARRQASSAGSLASESDSAGSDVRYRNDNAHSNVQANTASVDSSPSVTGAGYAVAVFPYRAEAPDELDVELDDAFVVLSRTPGWWMVQRDNSKYGTSCKHPGKQGWVPSGALLQITVPLAKAVSEAMRARKSFSWRLLTSSADVSKPVLRSSIRSASFAAVVLREYYTKGDGEVDLVMGDLVKVYKRYSYWSYIVQENGDRGWVPSWFLGKASSDQ